MKSGGFFNVDTRGSYGGGDQSGGFGSSRMPPPPRGGSGPGHFNTSGGNSGYRGGESSRFESGASGRGGFGREMGRPKGSSGGYSGHPQNYGAVAAKGFDGAHGGKWEYSGNLRPATFNGATPTTKNFYHENPHVKNRTQVEVGKWLAENNCTLEGHNIPNPILEFGESTFPDPIIKKLFENFKIPTPIQSISWPVAMSGRDMISIARTGSGKTIGFMLPGIVHALNQTPRRRSNDGPSILVLLPTRELALQVEEVAKEYCSLMNLSICCCYGGAPKGDQARKLRAGIDVCIATPGRLLDFLEAGATNMQRCTYLVLDEADRMLDMGFEPQIRKVVSQIRPDRQTLMFSATWPKDVRALAADFQTGPVHLHVGSLELSASHNILQHVEIIEENYKHRRLVELLEHIMKQRECKTLIFVETKRKADDITRHMRKDGWPALCIHGDKNQNEREWVLNEFKEGKTPILLATDVAARGLDISDIKFVINYDYPNNSEDYVHRIGRTGRRDKKGTSYTFFTFQNAPKAKDLIKVLEEAKQIVPGPLIDMANNSRGQDNSRSRYKAMKRPHEGMKNGPGPTKRRFDDYSGGENSWGTPKEFGGSRW